ncbi:16631_t:CDS:2, partial [Funneliformis geosporum]
DTNCFSYPSRPVMWEIRAFCVKVLFVFSVSRESSLEVFGVKRERVSSFEFFGSLQHFARKFFWVFSISHESSLEVFSVDHLG